MLHTPRFSPSLLTAFMVAGIALPPALAAQAILIGPSTAYYQFGRTGTARSERERVWTFGVQVSLPVLRGKGSVGVSAEHSVWRNQSEGPSVFGMRAEFQYALRAPAAAIVRPHVVAGLGALHFQWDYLIFTAACSPGFACASNERFSSTGWQLTGSAGIGLTLEMSPMLMMVPRAEAVLPLWRISGGSNASVYVRWSLAVAWWL